MGGPWHIAIHVVILKTNIEFFPSWRVEPPPVAGQSPNIDLNKFDSAAKDKQLVVNWRSAAVVVNELLDKDARRDVLIDDLARFLVVVPFQPTGTGFYERGAVESGFVSD